jgi:hypothetical protein
VEVWRCGGEEDLKIWKCVGVEVWRCGGVEVKISKFEDERI